MYANEPVVVYTLTDPLRAELLANMLRNEGISCFLGGIFQASTVGLPGTIIQVQVPAEHADHARKLIDSLEKTVASS